jgi:hypothetical protein
MVCRKMFWDRDEKFFQSFERVKFFAGFDMKVSSCIQPKPR